MDCTFNLNFAVYGSGMYNYLAGPTLTNCTFTGNVTGVSGGVYNDNADTVLLNCVFSGNKASSFGGALFNITNSEPAVVNCTFGGNEAFDGSGIYSYDVECTPTVTNCVFWGNADDAIAGDGEAVVTYSNVEEYDPLFVRNPDAGPDGVWGTEDDDYGDLRLMPGSLCIDAADNTAVPPDEFDLDEDGDTDEPCPFDLDGNPRFVDDPDTEDSGNGEPPIVDMGAYEFQTESCPADFDGNGEVNTADLLILLGQWGTDGADGGDVDGNGIVDTEDLLALLGAWGDCPGGPPPCPWDFNGDGVVDDLDADILVEHWGDCPDPPDECPWDLTGDGIVDIYDMLELFDHYGPCP
ncbi:MAG: dockerin type I domain-containing protein [Planctomycetota bacterium]|nr:dockerin type I domain-containing protein [Planctomycetota bacterium]